MLLGQMSISPLKLFYLAFRMHLLKDAMVVMLEKLLNGFIKTILPMKLVVYIKLKDGQLD
jgi:hypothetical protein